MEARNMRNECWSCSYRREVPNHAHIRCTNPDPQVTGDPYGIRNNWFNYPFVFDPVWKTNDCCNYLEINPASERATVEVTHVG